VFPDTYLIRVHDNFLVWFSFNTNLEIVAK
jgi:hypothetical protein